MDLQRGVCSLCTENTKVLNSVDAERFSKYLPKIMHENFLPDVEKIKNLIKICTVCCYKIELANGMKNIIDENADKETDKLSVCYFCKTDKCLVKIDKNWKYFLDRTEDFVSSNDFPLAACPRCVFYFNTIFNFKVKLLYKFPQLKNPKSKKSESTPNDTPKRKSTSKSPPNNKKRKIFENCFTYLQPLCNNSNYFIDDELKTDINLYKRIAYVNLKDKKQPVKETPRTRPIIKIKLKAKSAKHDKLSRSEEAPRKGEDKTKRRYSHLDEEVVEENINETPKSAILSNSVPKRRVSIYLTNDENEERSEETGNEVEIVEKNGLGESAEKVVTNGDSVLELNGEICQDVEDVEKDEDVILIDNSPEVDTNSEDTLPDEASKENKDEDSELDFLTLKPAEDISQIDIFEKESILSTSKDYTDDTLNGSERKKKRVTFSDEIID